MTRKLRPPDQHDGVQFHWLQLGTARPPVLMEWTRATWRSLGRPLPVSVEVRPEVLAEDGWRYLGPAIPPVVPEAREVRPPEAYRDVEAHWLMNAHGQKVPMIWTPDATPDSYQWAGQKYSGSAKQFGERGWTYVGPCVLASSNAESEDRLRRAVERHAHREAILIRGYIEIDLVGEHIMSATELGRMGWIRKQSLWHAPWRPAMGSGVWADAINAQSEPRHAPEGGFAFEA